jgi:preprotein translocase subunit Sec61beta
MALVIASGAASGAGAQSRMSSPGAANAAGATDATSAAGAGPAPVSGGHTGAVHALVYDSGQGRILSAGADGFLGIWNPQNNTAVEQFQLSSYSLQSMILRPGKSQIALVESDGLGLYRISAWDYGTKKNLFILRFKDPISYINYSAGGNFLIVARSARTGVAFIHPETGEVLESPSNLTGSVIFAATGRSERTMISYTAAGILSYWELESGEEIQQAPVPANMASPLLFGNNRFFGGLDSGGLVVLDAVSGKEIARDRTITRGRLFPVSPESAEFVCLTQESGGGQSLISFGINAAGRLETRSRRAIPPSITSITSVLSMGNNAALGTAAGVVWTFSQNGTARVMATMDPLRIDEIAASGPALAFISGDKQLGFIPLDYKNLRDRETISLEGAGNYSHISPGPSGAPDEGGSFLLWQSDNTRLFPAIKRSGPRADGNGAAFPGPGGAGENGDPVLNGLSLRFPLRSVSVLEDQALFLDSMGTITVLSTGTGNAAFSYSSAGALDVSFLNGENIIIGRVAENAPFLMVNIRTGETVPMAYPSSIGAKVYRGPGGTLYGAVVDQSPGNVKTAIVSLNPLNPAQSFPLVEYQGEDTGFSIAECGGILASTIGGDGASLYGSRGFIPFERSSGLPIRLIEGEGFFIALDKKGAISWHDPRSGKLLALLRIYPDQWRLETGGGQTTGGAVRAN